jgi:hypothetical protein
MLLFLKVEKKGNRKNEDEDSGNDKGLLRKICCNVVCRPCRWMKQNMRCPKVFEVIAILNIVFTYFCVLMRYQYAARLKDIKLEMNKFNDLDQYVHDYEMLVYLYCANILVYMFGIINQISNFFEDFKTIIAGLIGVRIKFILIYF